MTPEQCRELAEYHEHMEQQCYVRVKTLRTGTVVASLCEMAWLYQESARYWREKADG